MADWIGGGLDWWRPWPSRLILVAKKVRFGVEDVRPRVGVSVLQESWVREESVMVLLHNGYSLSTIYRSLGR